MRRTIILRVVGAIVAFYVVMALVALALRRLIPSIGDETSDEIALAAAGRGIELKSRAAAFRGGSARAIMGGLQLDLREATLAPDGARLEVRAIMGGAEILVPEAWPLRIIAARGLMGGVDYPEAAKAATDVDGPVLELSLLAIMGGIEVKAQAPDSDPQAVPTTRG
ncbi:MAG: hypothetical protein ACRDJE_10515 [Dehalococcoidia bacterium]